MKGQLIKSKYFCKEFLIIIILMMPFLGFFNDLSAQLFGSSVKDDKETGAKMDVIVEEQIGYYNSGDLTNYLSEIGNRLVGELKKKQFDFQFKIVEQRAPNAFAIPGGYVYFSRGLLPLANTEGELACVLGHEITHVTERHSTKQAERGIFSNVLKIPGNLVGAFVGQDIGNLINSPINLMGSLGLSSYSRKHETEADEKGMELAAKAGYDPVKLGTLLQQLEKDVEMQTGHKSEFSFFSSHPMTDDRVENIEKEAEDLKISKREGIAESREEFLMKLDGLCYGVNPATGVFHEEKFLHPDLGFTITFPKEWKFKNTPSAVGAYTEEQDGLIFIAGIGQATDPEKIGEQFVKKIKKENGVVPERAEKKDLNSFPAYVVVIRDNSGKQPAHFYYLWVTMGDLTYNLIGGGLDSYYDMLASTVKSLRPITEAERKSITINRIRLAKAKEGESISDLCSRTDNVWKPEYTAMINELDASVKLSEGQLIKIAKQEPYK